MKVGKYAVKPRFKLARIISDVLSLGIAAVILILTLSFFPAYKAALSKAAGSNPLEIVMLYGNSLTYRHKFAWIFPIMAGIVLVVYAILTFSSRKFPNLRITDENAQSVYDWYAFTVSLCKIPVLTAIFDVMIGFQRRMMFEDANLFNLQILLYFLAVVIIIRFSAHRLRKITEPKNKKDEPDDCPIKVRIAEDEDEDD